MNHPPETQLPQIMLTARHLGQDEGPLPKLELRSRRELHFLACGARLDWPGIVIQDRKTDGGPKAGQGRAGNILQHNGPPEPVTDAFYVRAAEAGAIFGRPAAAEERL